MAEAKKVVVTASHKAPRDRSILETPPGKEDLQVVVMSWWKQAAIRTGRTYLQTLVTFILAGLPSSSVRAGLETTTEAVGISVPADQFLGLIVSAASLALGPAIIAFLQNMVEILGKLDNPQTRA